MVLNNPIMIMISLVLIAALQFVSRKIPYDRMERVTRKEKTISEIGKKMSILGDLLVSNIFSSELTLEMI